MLIASDTDLARVWLAASTNRSELSEIDSIRYFLLSRARWLRMQNSYLQWRRGMLSDEDWSIYFSLICKADIDGNIRFKSTWDEHQLVLTERFVNFVNNCWSSSQ